MKRRTAHRLFIALFLVVLVAWVWTLSGCAKGLEKGCKELTNAYDVMLKAEVVAKAGHDRDPNIITEDHLFELGMIVDTLGRLRTMTCNMDALLSQREK